MGKISCCKSIWTTLVEKYWKSCKTAKIGHSKIDSEHFSRKILGKLQNGQNWPFWINLDHFGKKILETLQNSQNWPFWINLNHFGRKILEKLQNSQNWSLRINLDHLKILETLKNSQNWPFGSISTTLVGKYWESCKTVKIGHSEQIWTTLVGKY